MHTQEKTLMLGYHLVKEWGLCPLWGCAHWFCCLLIPLLASGVSFVPYACLLCPWPQQRQWYNQGQGVPGDSFTHFEALFVCYFLQHGSYCPIDAEKVQLLEMSQDLSEVTWSVFWSWTVIWLFQHYLSSSSIIKLTHPTSLRRLQSLEERDAGRFSSISRCPLGCGPSNWKRAWSTGPE